MRPRYNLHTPHSAPLTAIFASLLHVLREMGHGDVLVISDCNFPAAEVAKKTTSGKHIVLSGVDLPRALDGICSLLP